MRDSAAIRLLAADNAPVILALIAEYFSRETRERPTAEVYELMVTDFKMLASAFSMPRTPQNYCNDWVKAGWLIRKSGKSSHGETLEPSEEALSALEAIERWEAPVTTVTASRVESISSALQRLARDTNEDIASRVASLEEERDRIDRETEKPAAASSKDSPRRRQKNTSKTCSTWPWQYRAISLIPSASAISNGKTKLPMT